MTRFILPEDKINFLDKNEIRSKSLIIVAEEFKIRDKQPFGRGKSRHRRFQTIAKGNEKAAYCYDDREFRSKL